MTMTTTRPRVPSGFTLANEQQAHEFECSGSVHGASKVTLVDHDGEQLLAVRLRPPRSLNDIRSRLGYVAAMGRENPAEWYITQYNLGWQASTRVSRTGHDSEAWGSGTTNYAWDDGYLDNAAGRPKWHLTYCRDHDTCGEG
jgi:hypothetical protein